MFDGKLRNVVMYCEEISAAYKIADFGGPCVYVYEKKAREMKEKNPRKYANLFVSYLRLSEHEGHSWLYGRYDGWCQYYKDEDVKKIIDDLTKGAA